MKTQWIELPPDFTPGDIVGWCHTFIATGSYPACDRAKVVAADRRIVRVRVGAPAPHG